MDRTHPLWTVHKREYSPASHSVQIKSLKRVAFFFCFFNGHRAVSIGNIIITVYYSDVHIYELSPTKNIKINLKLDKLHYFPTAVVGKKEFGFLELKSLKRKNAIHTFMVWNWDTNFLFTYNCAKNELSIPEKCDAPPVHVTSFGYCG